jgi:two-component system CheB/CheR fusion protein
MKMIPYEKKPLNVFVAIGSSAGGFEAMSEFVSYLPKKTGFYYFLAQHHALGEKSILSELLQRKSKIKILLVSEAMAFKPDTLYVLPPHLQISINTHNIPTVVQANLDLHLPLPNADQLFATLSTVKNAKTIAILLSGTGHDGTEGMRTVKECGGITIAQNPNEAMFEGMPLHAIEAHVVDYTLNIEDIINKLVKLSHAFAEGTYTTEEIPFDDIVKILHKEKQFDLFQYKEETIVRRIQKRMETLKIPSLEAYAQYFKDVPQEIDNLYQEVLIGVTEFFRGHESFEALRLHVREKLLQKVAHTEFRVWSVACSSGEEAYSLAIMIDDILQEIDKQLYVKIFASDIDDLALEKARTAQYKASALDHMKKEWKEKYFVKTDKGYRVVKKIREQVVFAHHNFLNNPAFINIDLISCRNVLIYLKSSVQSDVFSIFSYALTHEGLLFLGLSESTLNSMELFSTLDNKHRIYQKNEERKPVYLSINTLSQYPKKLIAKGGKTTMQKIIRPQEIEKYLQEDLFKYFKNSSLIIDDDHNIVYKKGEISYLTFQDGIVSLNLFDSLDKALHFETKKLIKQVKLSAMREVSKFIELQTSQENHFVQISLQPFNMPEQKPMFLINFNEIDPKDLLSQSIVLPSLSEESMIRSLSDQLKETQIEMENISEELSFSKQNMALMNSDLQDSNEKLQSTVEELETSNEELQSSNEELQVSLTSNRELQNRLALILESSIGGVMGLDMQARHTFVSEKAAKMLGYSVEYLLGKESHKLWHHTKPDGSYYPKEECPILNVLKDGTSERGEDLFWRKDGSSFPVEFLRSPLIEEDKIVGAVINFYDISEKKVLEQKVADEHKNILKYMDASGLIFLLLDTKGMILDINHAGMRLLGLSKENIIGLNWFDHFITQDEKNEVKAHFFSILNPKAPTLSHRINKIIDASKQEHLISWNSARYIDENGVLTGIIATGNDITNETFLADELQKLNIKYEQTFKAAQVGIAHVGLDGSWLDVNEYLSQLLGYSKEELLHLTLQDITHPDDLELDLEYVNQLLEGELNTYHMEKRYLHKNGRILWINLSVILIRDDLDEPQYFISIIQDISQIKMLMFELESKKSEFENIIRFAPNPIMIYDQDGKIILLNETFTQLTGYNLHEINTIEKWNKKIQSTKDLTSHTIINQLFEDNKSMDLGQIKLLSKAGEKLIWIHSVAPLANVYIGKKMLIYSATDVTKMQENEEMMLAQSRQAAMGDMIGMIAHQWRQPLSIIAMAANNLKADLLLEETVTEEDLNTLIETLDKQTQYLSQTIDDFRTFLQPQKAKKSVLLCTLYKKLRTIIGKSFESHQITLNFINDCDIEVTVFENELIQVFINLLNNAKDAILEQKVAQGYINITTNVKDDMLIIEIEDNGGGIASSVLNHLGEPYVSTKSKNGTGLGIYMSQMILNKHFDGSLSWRNCNDGSCFKITLAMPKSIG